MATIFIYYYDKHDNNIYMNEKKKKEEREERNIYIYKISANDWKMFVMFVVVGRSQMVSMFLMTAR